MDTLLEKKLAEMKAELLNEVNKHACKCAQTEEASTPEEPKEKTPEEVKAEKLAKAKKAAHERKLAREAAKKTGKK